MKSFLYARFKRILQIAISMALLFLCCPGIMDAHSALLKSSPAANSRLTESPQTVTLTFNEPLEAELYFIKVLDSSGEPVTDNKAEMSRDHTELKLDLPPLEDGNYTVSYKVISADGHPVGSSYVFSVGAAALSSSEAPPLQTGEGLSFEMTFAQIAVFLARILYYLCLLGLAGWTFWGLFQKNAAPDVVQVHRKWSRYLQFAFLVSFLLMAVLQFLELADQRNLKSLQFLLTGTTIGYSWCTMFVLSIAGFIFLSRRKWFDVLWIALLLGADSINGHAMSFQPKTDLVLLDWVHLFAAAIWTGGLLYIAVLWRRHREYVLAFLPRFSGWALSSLLMLILTGSMLTFAFLPKLRYVLYTQWGILLLCKIGLVLAVVIIGALLRFRMKKEGRSLGALLKIDFMLMVLITSIVGLFTYLNPIPVNDPQYWHDIGTNMHVMTEMTPNAPGDNYFYIEVSTLKNTPNPKQVQLRLTSKNDDDTPPMDVPLKATDAQTQVIIGDFRLYGYEAEGPFPPYPGDWELEVRVMDANDDESVFKHLFTIY